MGCCGRHGEDGFGEDMGGRLEIKGKGRGKGKGLNGLG